MTRPARPLVERVGPDDLMQLAADVGPVREQVGAVLVLEAGARFDAGQAADVVADRLGEVPRFRQVLRRVPLGCGRPIWVDDPGFEARRHVRVVPCRGPGDEADLLAEAVALVTEPLAAAAPPWRAAVVTGLTGSRAAVVVVFHHVLADGIGGLAVLGRLGDPADGVPGRSAVPADFPRPTPGRRRLAADAWAAHARGLSRVPAAVRSLPEQVAEVHRTGRLRASPSSLNRLTGRRRQAVVVRTELRGARAVAHAQRATVNDVVLAAVAGALRELLLRRGEPVPVLVASVPVARRTHTTAAELGNELGGMVVPLPVDVDRSERLRRTAAVTRTRKAAPGGEALMGPIFRLMGALGLVGRFVNRQHMVSTFVTNLRGPAQQLMVVGRPVLEILPVSHLTGNVTVTFAALSYAGRVVVTVTADPDACPDLDDLATLLQAELDAFTDLEEQDRENAGRDAG